MVLIPDLVLNLNQLFPTTVCSFFLSGIQRVDSVWNRADVKEILFTQLFSLASDDLQMASTSPISCHLESRFTGFKTWYSICKVHLHKAVEVTHSQKKI